MLKIKGLKLPMIADEIVAGNVRFVDSGGTKTLDDPNYGGDPEKTFATLDYAVGKMTANNGDHLILHPGHAETLSADSDVDIDQAGITTIGLGVGTNRPTFTFDTIDTADFKLAAANTKIQNLLFIAGIDALTGPIEVTAAECQIINCEYRDYTSFSTLDVIVTDTNAHFLLIDGLKYRHDGGTGGSQEQSVINLVSADFAEIKNCFLIGNQQLGCIEDATASKMISIHDNYIETSEANDVCITLQSTTTGFVYRNYLKIVTNGQVSWITATNDCALFENYGVNNDAETGGLIGTPST